VFAARAVMVRSRAGCVTLKFTPYVQ
jgi:hypothetical protein